MRSRGWLWPLAVATLLVLLTALSVVPFVRTRTAAPPRADAVIVLSGDHGERLPLALELLEAHVTRTLVFVGTVDGAEEAQMCAEGWSGAEVLCLRPQPDSTQAEARAVGLLGRERQWKRVVVVTSSYHAVRSGLLFRRCFDGEVSVISAAPPLSRAVIARQTVREWAATGYFILFRRSC